MTVFSQPYLYVLSCPDRPVFCADGLETMAAELVRLNTHRLDFRCYALEYGRLRPLWPLEVVDLLIGVMQGLEDEQIDDPQ